MTDPAVAHAGTREAHPVAGAPRTRLHVALLGYGAIGRVLARELLAGAVLGTIA